MNIAIVGAGNGGKKLIDLFSEFPEVKIKTVVDKNDSSVGIIMAKKLGISCVKDIEHIDSSVDMIIEATGNTRVQDMLNDMYGQSKRIVSSDVAQLLMKVIDKQVQTAERLNTQLEQISETSTKLHHEIDKILRVTDRLNVINETLVSSSEESKRFIKLTDEMIKAVNKITQQIKILGLNANIEAARAGEHGRGFSVVATEVQKMSDSTSTFATQISDLLMSLSEENEKISAEVSALNAISEDQKNITAVTKDIVDTLNQL